METKKCPYCGEEILAVAKKCKHCKQWLDDNHPDSNASNHPIPSTTSDTAAAPTQNTLSEAADETESSETYSEPRDRSQAVFIVIGILVVVLVLFLILGGSDSKGSASAPETSATDSIAMEAVEEVAAPADSVSTDYGDYGGYSADDGW